MTTTTSGSSGSSSATGGERLRRAFRRLNRMMVFLWRLGLGGALNSWPTVGGRIMVLVHTGRRSGLRRCTPLNYAEVGDAVYCVAGFGAGTDWYRNVLARTQVELWLPGRRVDAVADDISEDADRVQLVRRVLVASGFAAPLAGIPVRRLSDERLDELTRDYRLLRFTPTGPHDDPDDPDGPGDLAWVWPRAALAALAATIAAALAILLARSARRTRRSRTPGSARTAGSARTR